MLKLAFQTDPATDVTAAINVMVPGPWGPSWKDRFNRTTTVELPFTGSLRIEVGWRAEGPPGSAYSARLEVWEHGEILAAAVFEGKVAAIGVSVRADRLQFEARGPLAGGIPMASDEVTPATRSASSRAARDNAEYTVYYATNRARIDPADASKGYSAGRSPTVDYGSCRVFIPKSHKIGSLGSPWWKRLLTMTDDRLRLLGLSATSADEHWKQIRARLAADGDAVVFVHGYNVSFNEAALRAAQIGFDLQIKGAMAFFSWPSQGTLDGYLADAATIEASEGMIAGYLSDFAARSGATTVHVIAHSMGNRGVLRAVNRIAAAAQERSGVRFGHFILAAADVDADTFRQLSTAYTRLAKRTTLYVSARDRAVEASRWLHHFPRAGLIPPVLILPQIDTINVTNADLTMLGHGYVAGARDVLTDMHALIRHGHPPQDRFGLREAKTESGERYWLIGA
jgi:esterase/lipase superfamily enzyme